MVLTQTGGRGEDGYEETGALRTSTLLIWLGKESCSALGR